MVSISGELYKEIYRPQLHYTPPRGWLSDPNGLTYKDGIYHLFYQCRPDDIEAGKQQIRLKTVRNKFLLYAMSNK